MATGDLRLWFELRDRTSSTEMRTVGGKIPEECAARTPRHGDKSSARLPDRCCCGGASAGVRWNEQLLPVACDPMRCPQASLSLWPTSIRDELDPAEACHWYAWKVRSAASLEAVFRIAGKAAL